MTVLVVDIGGTHVKVADAPGVDPDRLDSGPDLTPTALVKLVLTHQGRRPFDRVTVGFPGVVGPHGPAEEPGNLGHGWVGFDFAAAFGKPTLVVNDAVMQALGAYTGGRMLFLGLGTGVGSALIADRTVVPLELGALTIDGTRTLADALGKAGLDAGGEAAWAAAVTAAVGTLRRAMLADYVVLGGGHACKVDPLPPFTAYGGNHDAVTGGVRLWEHAIDLPGDRADTHWRVVR